MGAVPNNIFSNIFMYTIYVYASKSKALHNRKSKLYYIKRFFIHSGKKVLIIKGTWFFFLINIFCQDFLLFWIEYKHFFFTIFWNISMWFWSFGAFSSFCGNGTSISKEENNESIPEMGGNGFSYGFWYDFFYFWENVLINIIFFLVLNSNWVDIFFLFISVDLI